MKNLNFKIIYNLLAILLVFTSCSNDNDSIETIESQNATLELEEENLSKSGIPSFFGRFVQTDQLARPIISVFLIPPGADSELYNITPPSELDPIFQPILLSQITGMSPAFSDPGDKNVLGQTATEFASFLATDVLDVSTTTTEPLVFSTNTLTGRKLSDDIITTVLQWIFAGEDLTENPGLSDDNVDANDVPFLSSFPYLAPPFLR